MKCLSSLNLKCVQDTFPAVRDTKKDPQVNLGKRFAVPIKKKLSRTKRGKAGENFKNLSALISASIAVKPMVKQSVNKYIYIYIYIYIAIYIYIY